MSQVSYGGLVCMTRNDGGAASGAAMVVKIDQREVGIFFIYIISKG